MADIAILVAEEYERRLNMERKGSAAAAAASEKNVDRQFHLVEINANWGSHSASTSSAESFMSRVAEIARKKGMVIIEPKSQIGVSASTGLFSA